MMWPFSVHADINIKNINEWMAIINYFEKHVEKLWEALLWESSAVEHLQSSFHKCQPNQCNQNTNSHQQLFIWEFELIAAFMYSACCLTVFNLGNLCSNSLTANCIKHAVLCLLLKRIGLQAAITDYC